MEIQFVPSTSSSITSSVDEIEQQTSVIAMSEAASRSCAISDCRHFPSHYGRDDHDEAFESQFDQDYIRRQAALLEQYSSQATKMSMVPTTSSKTVLTPFGVSSKCDLLKDYDEEEEDVVAEQLRIFNKIQAEQKNATSPFVAGACGAESHVVLDTSSSTLSNCKMSTDTPSLASSASDAKPRAGSSKASLLGNSKTGYEASMEAVAKGNVALVTCPACQVRLQIPEEQFLTKLVYCLSCQSIFRREH